MTRVTRAVRRRRAVPTTTQPRFQGKTKRKQNATSGLGLTSNRARILETTLNVKKATRRRRRPPLPPTPLPGGRGWGPKSVSLFRWCIKRDIVVFTPLNYIQTFKIQIFFFLLRNVGHAFLLNLHILREALELRVTQQTWQDPKFKYVTALNTSIIEKQRNTNRL